MFAQPPPYTAGHSSRSVTQRQAIAHTWQYAMKTETPSNRGFTIKAIWLGVILIATLAAIEAGLRVYFLRLNSFPYIAHMFRDDPITGFALTPNMRIHAVGDGNDFTLDTKSMGLRGKEPLTRAPDGWRTVVMGDSYPC